MHKLSCYCGILFQMAHRTAFLLFSKVNIECAQATCTFNKRRPTLNILDCILSIKIRFKIDIKNTLYHMFSFFFFFWPPSLCKHGKLGRVPWPRIANTINLNGGIQQHQKQIELGSKRTNPPFS